MPRIQGWFLLLGACAAATPARPMRLARVVLYQNGIGYFERTGHVGGDTLHLAFSRGELDDVLKTLTVIDRLGAAVATVDVPTPSDKDRAVELGVRLAGGRVHDVNVSYAVPTPTWKAAYRVVLDDKAGLLQAWAMVNNSSQEDWTSVALTLATGQAMSYALDLHTPEYVKRPDATGHMVAPLLGPVEAEKVGASDSDGDGIMDVDDRCPFEPEDRDGIDDVDGCPDPDNDHDGIPDARDKCPNEPEIFNGFQDDDGCPDRGRVVITATSIEVLERIYFGKDGDVIAATSRSILDAVAATLKGNPDIARIEIGGHASSDEPDPWGVASRRAGAVRDALVQRGIDMSRLVIVPFGATRPVDPNDPQKNRRVDFEIASRRDHEVEPSHHVIDVEAARAAVRTTSKPADVAGSVRYAVGAPVTIRRGAATLVSILNKPIGAEDALLFRPDSNAPGSDVHPFRAVRIANDSGFTLEPGPVALFAHGTYVGDGLLGRLDLGEIAWVPYAVDGSTSVTVESKSDEKPVRIVAIQRGVITVETAGVRVSTYTIRAGHEAPRQLYLHAGKAAGFTARDLPPGTQDQGTSYLVPLPLQAKKTSTFTIEEREPRQRKIQLLGPEGRAEPDPLHLGQGATQLELYLEGSHLTPQLTEQLRAAIALRTQLGTIEDELDQLRGRVGDFAQRAGELRENLKALDKVRGADDLRKKLVTSLVQASSDADAAARAIATKNEALAAARTRLQDMLREISFSESPSH